VSTVDTLLRIDIGGNGFVDVEGNAWAADYGFQGGNTSYREQRIANTYDEQIHYGKRFGENISYDLVMDNGFYDVVIHTMDPKNDAQVGSRVFDVFAEGELRLDNFDIYVALGANAAPRTAVAVTIQNVEVTDGVMDLDFATVAGRPVTISGIEVTQAA